VLLSLILVCPKSIRPIWEKKIDKKDEKLNLIDFFVSRLIGNTWKGNRSTKERKITCDGFRVLFHDIEGLNEKRRS